MRSTTDYSLFAKAAVSLRSALRPIRDVRKMRWLAGHWREPIRIPGKLLSGGHAAGVAPRVAAPVALRPSSMRSVLRHACQRMVGNLVPLRQDVAGSLKTRAYVTISGLAGRVLTLDWKTATSREMMPDVRSFLRHRGR